MTTDDQQAQANTMLGRLAEATVECPECGNTRAMFAKLEAEGKEVRQFDQYEVRTCPVCDATGTILDPRTELFRVTFCESRLHEEPCPEKGEHIRCGPHRESCKVYRPLTPDEARGKFEAMLEEFRISIGCHSEKPNWDWSIDTLELFDEEEDKYATPLLAILSAVSAAVGVEVTA